MGQSSAELFARSQRVSPGGVHSPVRAFKSVPVDPVFIEKAKGAYIYDVEDKRYTDFCMSWGPLMLGHADPDVHVAVSEAIARGWSYGTAERYSLELAELITESIPWVESLRFVNSGTEAVMSALRLARAFTGRDMIVKFDGCYHGHADGMLVRAGSGLAEMANPDSAGVTKATASETLVAPLNNLGALEEIFLANSGKIAAIIVEPLPANNGLLIPEEGFLKGLVDLAHEHGSLVIFDEVISGFRVAFGGMAEVEGLRPDLVTYGKVIGGGFPVGAFGGRRDIMENIAPLGAVYQAGTLSANPVAMTAGYATLSKLKKLNPFAELAGRVDAMGSAMLKAADEHGGISFAVQNYGSLFWSILGADSKDPIRSPDKIPASQKELYGKLFVGLLKRGFYLAPSGYEVGFLSTAHSQEDCDGLVAAFKEALSEV